jgi:DNA-binding transcriptional ArsR family regulator
MGKNDGKADSRDNKTENYGKPLKLAAMKKAHEDNCRKIRQVLNRHPCTLEELQKETGLKDSKNPNDDLGGLVNDLLDFDILRIEEVDGAKFYYPTSEHYYFQRPATVQINDPDIMPFLTHEKKQLIMKSIQKEPMTIMDLSKATKMNAGTIKRHLTDLEEAGLVALFREAFNDRKILLKYYTVAADKFIFHYEWPPNKPPRKEG